MNLIKAYELILNALRLSVTEDGFIRNADEEQIIVNKRSLVMPVAKQLAVPDMSNRIFFNPFRENALASETPAVTEYIRGRFLEHISMKTMLLISELADIAAKTAIHPTLSPEQLEFLVSVQDMDESFLTNLARLLDKLNESSSRTSGVAHVFSRKNSKVGDKEYRRVAFVSFPLYEILTTGDKEQLKAAGLNSLRPKDRKILIGMLQYIFPKIAESNSYSKGSSSGVCPYMDSLMQAFGGLIERLNDVVELFVDHIESTDLIMTPVEWFEAFQDLTVFQNELRILGIGGDSTAAPSSLEASVAGAVNGHVQQQAATLASAGAPVVLTLPGIGAMVSLAQGAQTALQTAPLTANGSVDLSAVIAGNPVLQQQLLMQALTANPAYASHLQQIQQSNKLQSKARRWMMGGTAAAANQVILQQVQNTDNNAVALGLI